MLGLITACASEYPLNEEKMVEILSDVMVMESGNAVQYNYGLLPQKKWATDYALVCKKHGTDTATFRANLLMYEKDPEKYTRVMEKVITRLQQQEIQKKVQKP